jgi:anti-sigma B factor antagonist
MPESHTGCLPCRTVHVVGETTVVELCGEIDLLTAPFVAARLDSLTAGPRSDLVLDLRPVTFIDCTGLGLLCRARNRATARQGRLRLVTDSARLLGMLRHAGLAGAFEIHAHLAEAMTDTRPTPAVPAAAA